MEVKGLWGALLLMLDKISFSHFLNAILLTTLSKKSSSHILYIIVCLTNSEIPTNIVIAKVFARIGI